eukprot:gnl/TRDRNA2_/TRDRNA2_152654_c2_seq1.p1 gnl/TRDRNA2_/TRDRNA2_152654_c2~~gnl/TRDRNA2_/TRDRNA2_152654_c2_seq1.p1  ORF type:complete len:293 (-),score=50.89 gnl/TRDRNA2_/TRDRNA2_152654_c2_seq1:110-895(-)
MAGAMQHIVTQMMQVAGTVQHMTGTVHLQTGAPAGTPGANGGAPTPIPMPSLPPVVRMRVARVLHFRLGSDGLTGRLKAKFEIDTWRDASGRGAPPPENLEVTLVRVELQSAKGGMTLAEARRAPQPPQVPGQPRSLGPWSPVSSCDIETQWEKYKAAAAAAAAAAPCGGHVPTAPVVDLRQLMRLMAALLGAALGTERVPVKRLMLALRAAMPGPGGGGGALGPSPPEAAAPERVGRQAGAPLGPAELLAHPPFSEIACA